MFCCINFTNKDLIADGARVEHLTMIIYVTLADIKSVQLFPTIEAVIRGFVFCFAFVNILVALQFFFRRESKIQNLL